MPSWEAFRFNATCLANTSGPYDFKAPSGLVADNIRIYDNSGMPVVVANAPGGWEPPVNLIQKNNRNHLSDRVKMQPKRGD